MIALRDYTGSISSTMPNRRILIATPLKGDIPKSYFQTSLQLATATIQDVKLDWVLLDGPAVMQARNEIVTYALDNKFDELIFWDKDVQADIDGRNQTAGAILRLISHDEDMVCGIYSTRSLDTHWHMEVIDGENPNDKGLQKVKRSAIGFSKIKMSVFKAVMEKNPDRMAVLVDPLKAPKQVFEFFPMGIQGPNTPEGRIAKIKDDIERWQNKEITSEVLANLVSRNATIKFDEPNCFASEDYWFCDLVRAAGIPIHIDTMLVLGHEGKAVFPITTPRLLEILSEPWRKEELIALKAKIAAEQAAKARK